MMISPQSRIARRLACPAFLPVVTPAGIPRLPLFLVLGWIAATFLLFLIWPINWPIYHIEEWERLVAYVSTCLLVIGAAAWTGSKGPTRLTAPLSGVRSLLVAGALAAALLLTPSCVTYTGRGPWELLDAMSDQGAAYRRLQANLVSTAGHHSAMALARAFFAPLVYAVLPLGILRWRDIGWSGRLSVAVTAACSIVFSLMRGTDKEIADLFVIGVSAMFVLYGRAWAAGHRGTVLLRRFWRWALAGALFVYAAQALYTERKDLRLNARHLPRSSVCANATNICADLANPWITWMPPQQRFGVTLFILSTCSGYYGLDLALRNPFESSFGVGHSPVALTMYETLTGDRTPHLRTYTYRNGEHEWLEEYYWSTLVTWIANDVGFPGAALVLGLIGYMWGIWWREAAAGMSDPAAILFALTTTMMFYFPANNQVFLTPDGYTIFAVWTAVWLWHRARRTVSVALPCEAE